MNTEVGGVLSPALKQNNHHSAAQHVLHTFKLKQMRMIFSLVSVCVCVCVCVCGRAGPERHTRSGLIASTKEVMLLQTFIYLSD